MENTTFDETCPFCNNTITDLWDLHYQYEQAEIECPFCSEKLIVYRDIVIKYNIKKR